MFIIINQLTYWCCWKAPTVPCYDICNPELLDRTCPAAPQPNSRKTAVSWFIWSRQSHNKLGSKNGDLRFGIATFEAAIFSPAGILSDDALKKLASVVSPIENLIGLEHALGGGWAWFTYGDELLVEIKTQTLPFKSIPKQKQKRAAKRSRVDVDDGESLAKWMRVAVAPTPVRPNFHHNTNLLALFNTNLLILIPARLLIPRPMSVVFGKPCFFTLGKVVYPCHCWSCQKCRRQHPVILYP